MHKEENCWNNPKNKAMKPNAKLQKNKKHKNKQQNFCFVCGKLNPNHKPEDCSFRKKNPVDGKKPQQPPKAAANPPSSDSDSDDE